MSTLLEVVISLAFIFLIFSIIVSGCCELWQLFTHKRGMFLYKALSDVFNDRLNKDFTFQLLSHPLIDSLRESDTRYPTYIGATTFADALIDVIRSDYQKPEYKYDHNEKKYQIQFPELTPPPKENGEMILAQFLEGTNRLHESDLKQLLRTLAFGANNYDDLKKNITSWYNRYMEATSTWYKKYITKTLITFSAIITIAFNIDAIHLTQSIYSDKNLRERLVQNADIYVRQKQSRDSMEYVVQPNVMENDTVVKARVKNQIAEITKAYKDLGVNELPIGWPKQEGQKFFLMICGWLITIAALGYGADNWFNLLMKFLNARTSVKPKE